MDSFEEAALRSPEGRSGISHLSLFAGELFALFWRPFVSALDQIELSAWCKIKTNHADMGKKIWPPESSGMPEFFLYSCPHKVISYERTVPPRLTPKIKLLIREVETTALSRVSVVFVSFARFVEHFYVEVVRSQWWNLELINNLDFLFSFDRK